MSKREVKKPAHKKMDDMKSPRVGPTSIQEMEWSRPHIQFMSQIIRKTFYALGLEDSEIDTRLQNLQDLCAPTTGFLLLPTRPVNILKEVKADVEDYLKGQEYLHNVVRVQSLVRRWLTLEKFKDLNSSDLHNVKIYNMGIMELIRTERVYVDKLAHLFNNVVSPLKKMETDSKQKHPIVLNKGDVQTLFWNMEQILRLHMYLLQSMETVVKKSWPFCEHLAEPFTKLIPSFVLYGDYVEHYQAAKAKLKELQKQPKFTSFLQEKQVDPNMMLLLPLNRIPDYNLMLEGLVQKSPFDNQEAEELVMIQTIIKESASLIKKKMEHSEHVAVNDKIQKSIVNFKGPALNMEKERVFQKEIFFGKKYLFLFNDLLLVCNPLKKGYELVASSDFESIELADIPDTSNKFGFEIRTKTLSKPLQLMTKNKEDKIAVFEELNRIITEKKIRVYGKDLNLLLKQEGRNSPIPIVIENLMNEIQQRGLETEGIFRVEGGSTDVQKLRQALDKNPKHPINNTDMYELGQVLKQYFRELPVPLIPFEFYPRLISLQKQHTPKTELAPFMEQLRLILKELPPQNYQLLQYLMNFLSSVSSRSSVNKMGSQNLGIVFGPNLIRPKEQTFQTSVDIPLVYTIVQTMIDQIKLVFGNEEILSSMVENHETSVTPTPKDRPVVVVTRRTVTKYKTSTLTQKDAYVAMTSRLRDLPTESWDTTEPPVIPGRIPRASSEGFIDDSLVSIITTPPPQGGVPPSIPPPQIPLNDQTTTQRVPPPVFGRPPINSSRSSNELRKNESSGSLPTPNLSPQSSASNLPVVRQPVQSGASPRGLPVSSRMGLSPRGLNSPSQPTLAQLQKELMQATSNSQRSALKSISDLDLQPDSLNDSTNSNS